MFAKYAPHYWAKQMPAIPLRPRQKVPAINAWSQFASKMPSEAQQEAWLDAYADGNIGLPLGSQSGVVGLDLDTDDQRVLDLLLKLMPMTPYKRVGKKGAVYAFRYNGERTYRIKDEDNNTILELLSGGCQFVLAPSIHPDTQRPYEATGELYDMRDRLPVLPADFEQQVRDGLIALGFKLTTRGRAKVSEWVPAGGRDSAMTAHAGIQARGIMRGERSLMEAMREMEVWCETYVEKIAGDPVDVEKGKQKVMEFLQRDLNDGGRRLPPIWSHGMSTEDIEKTKVLFGEDSEEWATQRILEHLYAECEVVPRDDMPGRTMLVETILGRVARSTALTAIDHDVILSAIVAANGKLTTKASLQKRLRDLQRADMVGENHSEIASALLKELEREGDVRFHNTRFYRWKGSHWEELKEHEIHDVMQKQFGSLAAAKRFSDHKGIISMAAMMATRPLKASDDISGINFANGFLTPDMELLNHDPDLGCTYVLPYRYVIDDRAPAMWLSLLDQCWGEETDYEDRVQALRESIAATLFGMSHQYARAFCLFGVAASGKSTVLNIIKGLIPEAASSAVPPHDWGDKFLPTQMEGKLINFCGELSESQLINGASFKQIVEGAEISGQFKGKDIFKFRPICSQWFAGNHIPRSRDTSEGFVRRWLFFTFNRTVPSDQKRANLKEEILSEEREAIVAWAVPAIQDLMKRSDYVLPACHWNVVSDVENQNNSVRQFLSSGTLTFGEGERVEEANLYQTYYSFCKIIANVAPLGRARFRLGMKELAPKFHVAIQMDRLADGTEKCVYAGIALKQTKKAA